MGFGRCCAAACLLFLTPARADDAADFRAAVEAWLPRAGAIEMSYLPSKGKGEYIYGWDAGSGAWYIGSEHNIYGLEPSGRRFSGEPKRLADVVFTGSTSRVPDDMLDRVMAMPMLRDILDRPDRFRVARTSAGFEVTAEFRFGFRNEPDPRKADPAHPFPIMPWKLETNEKGVPIALTYAVSGADPVRAEYHFRDGLPAGFLLSDPSLSGWKLASWTYTEHPDPARFERERVAALGLDVHVRSQQRPSGGPSPGGGASPNGTPAPSGVQLPDPLASYRLPLLIFGVVLAGIGVLAWWRRRGASA